MELEYRVRGADGKEYGPANLEQLNEWIQQGRLRQKHEVRRNDMEHWVPAGDFLELQPFYEQPVNLPAAVSGPHTARPEASEGSAMRRFGRRVRGFLAGG